MSGKPEKADQVIEIDPEELEALQHLLVWRRLYNDYREDAFFSDVFEAIELTRRLVMGEK